MISYYLPTYSIHILRVIVSVAALPAPPPQPPQPEIENLKRLRYGKLYYFQLKNMPRYIFKKRINSHRSALTATRYYIYARALIIIMCVCTQSRVPIVFYFCSLKRPKFFIGILFFDTLHCIH